MAKIIECSHCAPFGAIYFDKIKGTFKKRKALRRSWFRFHSGNHLLAHADWRKTISKDPVLIKNGGKP